MDVSVTEQILRKISKFPEILGELSMRKQCVPGSFSSAHALEPGNEAKSCIRGYHIYKAVWMPYIGETMPCSRELTNGHDPFAVKVSQLHGEEERIVGHLPRKISSICSIFLRRGKRHTH